ncbi:hypothetical protein B0H19DRAFT_1079350 [Mycena capillaripes]|nr:hypothetical protein B0H19DRAFT_1079350 [Mycena capillaripes]
MRWLSTSKIRWEKGGNVRSNKPDPEANERPFSGKVALPSTVEYYGGICAQTQVVFKWKENEERRHFSMLHVRLLCNPLGLGNVGGWVQPIITDSEGKSQDAVGAHHGSGGGASGINTQPWSVPRPEYSEDSGNFYALYQAATFQTAARNSLNEPSPHLTNWSRRQIEVRLFPLDPICTALSFYSRLQSFNFAAHSGHHV